MSILVSRSSTITAWTYSDLKTYIANYMHRADLTSMIPQFIRLAEDVIFGDLEIRSIDVEDNLYTVANTDEISLPDDFINFKRISVTSSTPNEVLTFMAPEQMAQQFQYGITDQPRAYTVIGQYLKVAPIPDAVYTLSVVYTAKLASLSDTNTSNFLIATYPSIYLYQCLIQACLYTKQDPSKYVELYNKAIEGVNMQEWDSAGIMQVRTDVSLTNYK